MKYWPVSLFMHSRDLNAEQKRELMHVGMPGAGISEATFYACRDVAFKNPACTSLVLFHSEGVGLRRVCLGPMNYADFIMLDRGGFFATQDNFVFILDALH